MPDVSQQLIWLFVLAAPIACIAWTVTHEELFAELRDWCLARSQRSSTLIGRKFFYLFTCEYCFSHWVTIFILILTGFQLLIDDWRGYILAFFVVAWTANQFMSLYRRLRVEIKHKNTLAKEVEERLEE